MKESNYRFIFGVITGIVLVVILQKDKLSLLLQELM